MIINVHKALYHFLIGFYNEYCPAVIFYHRVAYHLGFPNINFIVTFLPISVPCGPFESEKPIEILKNYTDDIHKVMTLARIKSAKQNMLEISTVACKHRKKISHNNIPCMQNKV